MLPRYLCAAVILVAACGFNGNYRDVSVPMQAVGDVDLARYQGLWYEIARFPNGFERDCTGVTAEYALLPDGRVGVRNICFKGTLDGPVKVAEGSARVAAPGVLKVKFADWLPLEGDYWIIGLDPNYRWAVVGLPSGDFGWILARRPRMAPADLAGAQAVLRRFGYDVSALHYTLQRPE